MAEGSFICATASASCGAPDLDLLRSVERVNERQKRWLVEKAAKHFGTLAGKTFGVWGLAF
jgi:UDPglucose 6-dehydrogenase